MISLDDIAQATAAVTEVSVEDIRGPSRVRHIANARQICYLVARRKTRRSLPQIGQFYGNRDHTTVIAGIASIERKAATDPDIANAILKASDTAETVGRAVFYRHASLGFKSSRARDQA